MKSILVTGATGNLGRQVVKTFLEDGDKIFGTVIPGESALQEFTHQIFKQ